ncbi:hypothetical protein ABPG74_003981 [Tetrahymena malaccensis]
MGDWCTIESDPGVFTELIRGIGVKGVQVEEVYSLEDQQLIQQIQPIYGLVFLFKWTDKLEKRECLLNYDQELFFANQVIQNACATQALLAILLNKDDQIDIGEDLKNFKTFTATLDPQMKGLAISNQENIQRVHNSFSRPEPFIFTQSKKKATENDDVFHFVSFVPFKGKLYELDGLQQGPILLGSYENDDWLALATQEINARILKYSQDEVRFNLLALTIDKRYQCQNNIKQLELQKLGLYQYAKDNQVELDAMQESDLADLNAKLSEQEKLAIQADAQVNKDIVLVKIADINDQIAQQRITIEEEEYKFKKYEVENVRRRHNYIPFIVELFRQTAKKGKLGELIEKAKQKKKEKAQAQQQQQKKN